MNFSFKKKKLIIATKIYPHDSSTGAIERGTTFSAYIDIIVHPKKSKYPPITYGFKYSLIFDEYFISALFFKRICDKPSGGL